MKTIIALLFVLCTVPSRAGMVFILWDAAFPAPETYAVWIRPAGEQSWTWTASTSESGTRLEGLNAGIYECQVTAVYGEFYHSEPTNTLTITVPEFLPGPQNLRFGRKVALLESRDMQHWHTVATYDVPEADRNFYRIAFTQ